MLQIYVFLPKTHIYIATEWEMLCNFVVMLTASILQSVEFYVIAVVFAAAVVAFLGRRPGAGPVRQILLPGVISLEEQGAVASIEFICDDDGSVLLRRHGVTGVRSDGAVSLAIEVSGFDVRIKERVVPGGADSAAMPVDTAAFMLDFMGREHYFISYTTEVTGTDPGLFASLTLSNRPGNRVVKPLQ